MAGREVPITVAQSGVMINDPASPNMLPPTTSRAGRIRRKLFLGDLLSSGTAI
jgi:hypothetical protein